MSERIVAARIYEQDLVLVSASANRLVIPLKTLATYIGNEESSVRDFVIDEDGAFLHWPHKDVHFGWEQFLHLVDPGAAVASKERSAEFNQRYGAAIRELREERALSQSQIDGLTDRHLRRIEQGEQAVTVSTVEALAKAHGMDVSDYMNEIAKRLS
jgi:hypothetical protein